MKVAMQCPETKVMSQNTTAITTIVHGRENLTRDGMLQMSGINKKLLVRNTDTSVLTKK